MRLKRKDRVIKVNMSSDICMICYQIETLMDTIRGTIAEKHTWLMPVLHFMVIVKMKKGLAWTPKNAQEGIGW